MRAYNIQDKFRLAFRDPKDSSWTSFEYLTSEIISDINIDWGFGQEKGIWPSSEPNTMTFTISKPADTSKTEWATWADYIFIGYQFNFQYQVASGGWYNYGQPYLVKSKSIQPDAYGNISYTFVCDDLWSRLQQLPLTMSDPAGHELSTDVYIPARVKAILKHCSTYFDDIFGAFYSGPLPNIGFKVPALSPANYNKEPAGGVLNKLLRDNLSCVYGICDSSSPSNMDFSFGGIDTWQNFQMDSYSIDKTTLIEQLPTSSVPAVDFAYGFTSNNLPFDSSNPNDHLLNWDYSNIEVVDDGDEIIATLRIEQKSDPSNFFSYQDADAIKTYGPGYIKETVDLTTSVTIPGYGTYDSIDTYGAALTLDPVSQRVKSLTAPLIDRYTGNFKTLMEVHPGAYTPVLCINDVISIQDQYMVNRINLRIGRDTAEATFELWKPNLTYPWGA